MLASREETWEFLKLALTRWQLSSRYLPLDSLVVCLVHILCCINPSFCALCVYM